MKRFFVKASIGAAGLLALLVPLQGCTNLDETPPSLISTSHFFNNDAEVLAALAGVYAQLRTGLERQRPVDRLAQHDLDADQHSHQQLLQPDME